MEFRFEDERWMSLALELAARGKGYVEPNPMVGCVLVKDGQMIGSGFHGAFGGPHAEVEALHAVSNVETTGATAYVTLEPCSHHGKTPPCCDALIDAKVARAVIAQPDPFPAVNGAGIRALRDAKIDVSLNVLRDQAEELNAPYLKRIRKRKPWVIAKWAMTADGRIATRDRESQWITGDGARRAVHALRGRVDAILVGTGTVVADNPMLTARLVDEKGVAVAPRRLATRVVACRHSTPSLDCNLVRTAGENSTVLYVQPATPTHDVEALHAAGVEIRSCRSADGFAFIDDMLRDMADRGVTNLMVEGGPTLLGSLLDESHCEIDELHAFVGAKLFGGVTAPGPIGGVGVGKLPMAPQLQLHSVDRMEDDARLIYRMNPH